MSEVALLCPTCSEAVQVERVLREDSAEDYNTYVLGHEDCDQRRLRTLVYRAFKPAPKPKDPTLQRRGRNNRKRGGAVERDLARRLAALGFEVIDQGGVGRRDKVVAFKDVRYSVECKSQQVPFRPFEQQAAYRQACEQALPGTVPIAFCRYARRGAGPATWLVVTGDGVLPWPAWVVSLTESIPLGAAT